MLLVAHEHAEPSSDLLSMNKFWNVIVLSVKTLRPTQLAGHMWVLKCVSQVCATFYKAWWAKNEHICKTLMKKILLNNRRFKACSNITKLNIIFNGNIVHPSTPRYHNWCLPISDFQTKIECVFAHLVCTCYISCQFTNTWPSQLSHN